MAATCPRLNRDADRTSTDKMSHLTTCSRAVSGSQLPLMSNRSRAPKPFVGLAFVGLGGG